MPTVGTSSIQNKKPSNSENVRKHREKYRDLGKANEQMERELEIETANIQEIRDATEIAKTEREYYTAEIARLSQLISDQEVITKQAEERTELEEQEASNIQTQMFLQWGAMQKPLLGMTDSSIPRQITSFQPSTVEDLSSYPDHSTGYPTQHSIELSSSTTDDSSLESRTSNWLPLLNDTNFEQTYTTAGSSILPTGQSDYNSLQSSQQVSSSSNNATLYSNNNQLGEWSFNTEYSNSNMQPTFQPQSISLAPSWNSAAIYPHYATSHYIPTTHRCQYHGHQNYYVYQITWPNYGMIPTWYRR